VKRKKRKKKKGSLEHITIAHGFNGDSAESWTAVADLDNLRSLISAI